MQMELFKEEEIISESILKLKRAKEYTVKMIYYSSGERGFINDCLQRGNKEGAFNWFDKGFRTFGFADDNYFFNSPIIYNDELECKVTSKELFNVLLNVL